MIDFTQLKIAVIAADGFEESELLEPVRAVRSTGAKVEILAPPTSGRSGMIQAFQHLSRTIKVPLDHYLDEELAQPDRFDAVILPGGALSADQLRTESLVIRFVQRIKEEDKWIAAICHAPWILISAELIRGKTLTSYHSIKDDVRNAGGHWVDQEAVIDGRLLTSRRPDDLPAFSSRLIELLSRPQPMISAEAKHLMARARIV